jgi:hypothetical protein
MNSKVLLFFILGVMVSFIACDQSDDENSNPAVTIHKIKSLTPYRDNYALTPTTYEYNEEGKLIKQTMEMFYDVTFTYTANKIIENHQFEDPGHNYIHTYLLNEKGLATKSFIVNKSYRDTLEYRYDIEGYQISSTMNRDTAGKARIENGNIVSSTSYKRDIKVYTTRNCEFLTNLNTIGTENQGFTWLGKQSKNLASHGLVQGVIDGSRVESTENYTYEYDELGRVKKYMINVDDQDYAVVFKYY